MRRSYGTISPLIPPPTTTNTPSLTLGTNPTTNSKPTDMSRVVKIPSYDITAEPKGMKRTAKWRRRIRGWTNDPMVRVRLFTAIRGAIAVWIPTLLVYNHGAFTAFPLIAIVLCGHFMITLMAHSIVGVVGIAIQSVTGGFIGCFFGYIAYLAAPNLAVKLVYLFVFCIILGLWDPYLKQGILVKWAIVDFFVVVFTPDRSFPPHSVLYGTVMLYVVSHWFSFVVSIATTLLLFPSLSSLEFTHEFRVALRTCSEVFKLISYRIDREILSQSQRQNANSNDVVVELEGMLHVHALPDADIKELEHRLSLRLIRLRRLMNESRAETWNPRVAGNDKLLEYINILYHHLINMHNAINTGKFSGVVNRSFLEPMLPFMETMQKSIITHFENLIVPASVAPPSPRRGVTTKLAKYEVVARPLLSPFCLIRDTVKSSKHEVVARLLAAVDLDESVRVLDEEYSQRVREFETGENVANPSREVTRLVYVVFGAVEFAHTLHDLEVQMDSMGDELRSDYRVIWTDVVLHGNLFPNPSPIKYCKDIVNHLKTMYNDARKLTWSSAWHSQMWRFPIRLAFGVTSLTLILFGIPSAHTDNLPYYTPYWASLTFVVVILPTLGATVRKCVHRFLGTITGAFLGHVFLLAILAVPIAARFFIHLILQIAYFIVVIYLQQVPAFGYSASVAGLTYLTVFIGQYKVGHGDVVYACMRCFFILIGVIWAFVIGNLFFPSKSSIVYTATLVDTITRIASIFNIIIEKSIEQAPEETKEKQEEIGAAIKKIHSSYLSMRNNLKEAKSELIFHWAGYNSYKNALHQSLKAHYTLSNMSTILGVKSFGPELHELMDIMKPHLRHLIPSIVESAHRIDDVFKKKQHIPHLAETGLAATTALHKLEKEYFLFRKRHIEQRTLSSLHPAIRQFTTFLYLIREFVMEWRILIETVNAFMGLTIEVYPAESISEADLEARSPHHLTRIPDAQTLPSSEPSVASRNRASATQAPETQPILPQNNTTQAPEKDLISRDDLDPKTPHISPAQQVPEVKSIPSVSTPTVPSLNLIPVTKADLEPNASQNQHQVPEYKTLPNLGKNT
eukprot:Phypoly_transcript_01353.p1 GENE.Phypoly_transcript_01353~~Phypoly_transcript_01353.p1  ORF type:complete len:1078 (+),score=113.14 Phypoly_transcript_01353:93-3326(+)